MKEGLEKKLVMACRNGDTSAYAELVEAYSGHVFGICLGMLSNSHDDEDIAQQALLKGFTDINHLQNSEQFGVWIRRIAKNLCIDFIRRQNVNRAFAFGERNLFRVGPQIHLEAGTFKE